MQKLSKLSQIGQRLLDLTRPIKIALAISFLFVLVLLLYPFQIVVVPEWKLAVMDDAGAIVSGIKVTEHWQHYLLETEGHEEQRLTDQSGGVTFPARNVRASLLGRLFARLSKFSTSGADARTDRYASLVIWGDKDHSVKTVVLAENETPPQKVIVQRRR